jgi:glucokinase
MEIVAVDIGGTHARFALAEVAHGRVVALGDPAILTTAEHASLRVAWDSFAGTLGRPMPRDAAITVACPVQGDVLKLTNNPWVIRPAQLAASLGLDRYTLVNDFGAVSHAVVQLDAAHLRHLHGPDLPLPTQGVISIVGPGTGLGVPRCCAATGAIASSRVKAVTSASHRPIRSTMRSSRTCACAIRACRRSA